MPSVSDIMRLLGPVPMLGPAAAYFGSGGNGSGAPAAAAPFPANMGSPGEGSAGDMMHQTAGADEEAPTDAFTPTRVPTVAVGPASVPPGRGFVPAGAAPAAAESAVPSGDSAVMAALRARMATPIVPPTSPRERLANSLVQFGRGMIESSGNVAGRHVGPGFAEAFAGGAGAAGKQMMDQNAQDSATAAAETARTDKLLTEYGKMGIDLSKIRSLDDYRKQLLTLGEDKLKQANNTDKYLLALIPSIIKNKSAAGEEITPEELVSLLQSVLSMKKNATSDDTPYQADPGFTDVPSE